MKKKAGFTLVELLAVIAILAVLILVAVPMILNIVNDAKEDSFRNNVRMVLHAIEIFAVEHSQLDFTKPHLVAELELNNKEFVNGIWTIENEEIVLEYAGTEEYSVRRITNKTQGAKFEILKGSFGNSELPAELLEQLGNPLGENVCHQTACYGFYSQDGCAIHGGTDVISDIPDTPLYAIGDGEITYLNRSNKQCTPDFETATLCGEGCTGNVITVKYTISLEDGTETVLFATYRHLASFADGITLGGTVTKGQQVGIMGTTGCSTGVHLHVELANELGQVYNAEEMFAYQGCNMNNACPSIRAYCKKA